MPEKPESPSHENTDSPPIASYFMLFNEIGIINQLGTALLEAALPDGLIAPHFAVLNHLSRVKDGQTPVILARAFQVPKTSMTHTLAGLEKHALIEMRPNPKDARSKQVWLTDTGRSLRSDTINALAPEFQKLPAVLSEKDLALVLPQLKKLREYLDAARD